MTRHAPAHKFAFGTKRTSRVALQMSALGGKADIAGVINALGNVTPLHRKVWG